MVTKAVQAARVLSPQMPPGGSPAAGDSIFENRILSVVYGPEWNYKTEYRSAGSVGIRASSELSNQGLAIGFWDERHECHEHVEKCNVHSLSL